ncbi:MAG TPA: 3-hydroxyacyl-CoA dehydrogenase NAD-binding domain-containing protein [Acetobacteraceae bacterium]|nr:3-hydroxyacyl-CoA dehydrogenase NAD-binding domain-containing protein [Acetobacteraceae bacterium]
MYEGIGRVAVLGTGTIGASWAAFFLSRGLEVTGSDPAPDAESFLRRFVENAWPALEALGLAPGADPGRLSFDRHPVAAVEGCGFVQENGPERLEVKQALLARIGAALGPDVLIASSSSTLLPSDMQAHCPHPERVVLGHPFNPPHLIPLVEVCGGKRTSKEAVDRAIRFYTAIGKRAIRLNKEMPGHVSNRLQAAIWREAAYLVEQGVVNVADVDAAVCQGPGIRWALMGPILTYHLGGGAGGLRYLLDHVGCAQLWPELGTPDMTPEFEQKLIDGVIEEVGGKPVDELARWRDRALVAILKDLKAAGAP